MKSKLGFHIDVVTYPGQIEKIIGAGTKILKVISTLDALKKVHDAQGDKTILIARDWNVGDNFIGFGGHNNPKAKAREWFDKMLPSIQKAPFAYWESFNEMDNWDVLAQYGEFEAERQRIMAENGFKSCIGNFAVGGPPNQDPNDVWPRFYPALEAAHKFKSLLGLHEYGALWMDTYYGPNQLHPLQQGKRVEFPDTHEEGWLFGLYRKVWKKHILPKGWTDIRIAITEFGLMSLAPTEINAIAGMNVGSWRTCGDAWARLNNRHDPAQYYFEMLQWADRQFQKDPYVVGACIFTWGTFPESAWMKDEIDGEVADKVLAHIKASKDDPARDAMPIGTPVTPAPAPTPVTTPEKVIVTPIFAKGVFLYASAGTQYPKLETLYMGDQLELVDPLAVSKIGGKGVFLQVKSPRGKSGWVEAHMVQQAYVGPHLDAPGKPSQPARPTQPTTPTEKLIIHTTADRGQYLRSGPGTTYRTVTSVFPSDALEVIGSVTEARGKLGKSGQWIQVRSPKGITGWGGAAYLEIMPPYFVWPMGFAMVGLHGPADPGAWPWDEDAYNIVRTGRVEAVKLLAAADIGGNVVNRLRQEGVKFIMARLFAKFAQVRTPESFVQEVGDAARRLYDSGVRHFEVHNEPNLHQAADPEGMWINWKNGAEFGQYFAASVALLKQRMPDAQFGFPGVSPGPDAAANGVTVRYDSSRFLAEADSAIRKADFVCMHTYWTDEGLTYQDSIREVRAFCDKYPKQLIICSEFANVNEHVARDVKGREYAQFYAEAKKLPSNIGALFSYTLSSSGGSDNALIRSQLWKGSPIAETVGKRSI